MGSVLTSYLTYLKQSYYKNVAFDHSVYYFYTSARFPVGQLALDAAVELKGDEAVGCHHDDPRD